MKRTPPIPRPRGAPTKARTPLAIFKKTSGLTLDEIARETGQSISTVKKVSSGISSPMPLQMAATINERYNVSRQWLRGEIKSPHALTSDGNIWEPGVIPAGPAVSYDPKDKVDAYLEALERLTNEISYKLPSPKVAPRGKDEKKTDDKGNPLPPEQDHYLQRKAIVERMEMAGRLSL